MKRKIFTFITTFVLFYVFSAVGQGQGVSLLFAAEPETKVVGRFPMAAQGPPKVQLENPPTEQQIKKSIGKATRYFLSNQNPKGTWGSARKTKDLNIYAPGSAQDGYLAGTTALALAALLETEAAIKRKEKPVNPEEIGVDPQELVKAIDKSEEWMLQNLPKLRRSAGDVIYNIWGHSYGVLALLRMLDRYPDDADRCEKIRDVIKEQIKFIEKYECVDGGWCYYDFELQTKKTAGSPNSFVTAMVLIPLWEAKQHGFDISQNVVKRAFASNLRQRYPDFSYAYGEYLKQRPMSGINRPPGSLARSQACNLASRLWGDDDVTNDVMENWLNRLVVRNDWLDIGRKRPVPHESHAQVAGYFYYFGMYYGAQCIDVLPEEVKPYYRSHIAAIMITRQGTDGTWFDYPLYDYGHQYATAYGLMSMLRTLP